MMQWVRRILIFIFCVFFAKNYIFSVYYIPTSSMQPTIEAGSYVLVTKYNYRLRTPPFIPFTAIPFPHYSINGFCKPKRGEIVVFNKPDSIFHSNPSFHQTLIKRVIGIPGDTVKRTAAFVKVKENKFDKPSYYSFLFQQFKTADDISYIIPEKGNRLYNLNLSIDKNWLLAFKRDGGKLKIDDVKKYKFSQNFYFMLGDNHTQSFDSRYLGLVPEENLIGKTVAVIWPWPPRWLE